jgi:dihydroflavonol-4-reductase
MKPTLVTGANGHVGNNLSRLLDERGERVRAMMRPTADPAPPDGLDIEIVRGDVLDADSTARVVEGCRQVYHATAGFLMWVTAVNPGYILGPRFWKLSESVRQV